MYAHKSLEEIPTIIPEPQVVVRPRRLEITGSTLREREKERERERERERESRESLDRSRRSVLCEEHCSINRRTLSVKLGVKPRYPCFGREF
jgi:hypothetical protein